MQFTDADKQYFEDVHKEVFQFQGDNCINYYPFTTSLTSGNPYTEEKVKTYGVAKSLFGKALHYPKITQLSGVGVTHKVIILFRIPYYSVKLNELHEVSIPELIKGKITYASKTYRIVNILKVAFVQDIPTFYMFECRDVK